MPQQLSKKHLKKDTSSPSEIGLAQEAPLKERDVKEGVSKVSVQSDDMGHIPGCVPHWTEEIESRKKIIMNQGTRSLKEKALGLLKRSNASPRVTGEEIMKASLSSQAKEAIHKLRNDPTLLIPRIKLIRLVLAKSKVSSNDSTTYSPEGCRMLFIQATVACSLGVFETEALEIALKTQEMYIDKVISKCRYDVDKVEDTLKKKGFSPEIQKRLQTRVKIINRNQRLAQSFREYATIKKSDKKTKTIYSVSKQELINSITESKDHSRDEKADKKAKNLTDKMTHLLGIARYMPLLHPAAHEMVDILIKANLTDPIPYFLKARLHMSLLVFDKNRVEVGDRNPEIIQSIQKNFNSGYHNYSLAAKRIGKVPKTQNDYAVLIEYANIVFFFYNVAKNILKINLPHRWLVSVIDKAIETTELAHDSGKVGNLQQALMRVKEQISIGSAE